MRSEGMFEKEAAATRRAVERDSLQMASENRKRWEGFFEKVEPDALPDSDALVFFATVDAYTVMGSVKAGQFFEVPAHLVKKFGVSKAFLAGSRAALKMLEGLRDALVAGGWTAQAAEVDLAPVRPPGGRLEEPRREPRTADQ